MSNWVPLHNHSHFSLLNALSKPEHIAKRAAECEYGAVALTDQGSVSGCPPFHAAVKKAGIKPILGEEFNVCQQDATIKDDSNRALSSLCVLAKNLAGWKGLMKASSYSCRPEYSYYKPRLDLERLAAYGENNFVVFSGHLGSDLANAIFTDPLTAYDAKTLDEAKSLVNQNWTKDIVQIIGRYKDLFGAENFFLNVSMIDKGTLPATQLVGMGLRWAAKQTGTRCVATADSRYARREDARDHRLQLCVSMETTFREVDSKLGRGDNVSLSRFFNSNNYHIPTLEEMQALHPEAELAATTEIADMVEVFDLSGPPMFPSFESDGKTSDQLLRDECIKGWKKYVDPILTEANREAYAQRVKTELEVLNGAGLANYFLIVQDYCNWARSQGMLLGPGRGSGAGCFTSYLLEIVRVNALEYDLLFERFYNAGRNTPGRVALPDIDVDFPKYRREEVIEYCRQKYGRDKVAQMATFAQMQGRGAIKDVLRVHGRCSFEEMNRITEEIPGKEEINDQLQDMLEETGEASIIRWALLHTPDQLKEWCELDKDGNLQGPMAAEFAQAIRMEGTKRGMGRHASGLVICSEVLSDVVPMVFDSNSGEMIVGVDMRDGEPMGVVKFDILSTTVVDKYQYALDLVAGRAM